MSSLRKLYDQEVREFFETAKQNLGMTKLDRKGISVDRNESGTDKMCLQAV
jgi:hypothetical protein